LLAGCIPSLNPVYTDQQLVFNSNLLGEWALADGKDKWEFSKRDDKSYQLVYTDADGHQGRFVARLADLNGSLFLDLFPVQTEDDAAGFYKFHLVPIHSIYRVIQAEPRQLKLAAIDYTWFDKYLTDHPGAIQFATFNGRKLITASTSDVQAFVLEHQEMFKGEFSLERR
jgi:hypothetical protein